MAMKSVSTYADQNCIPTPPSRSRGNVGGKFHLYPAQIGAGSVEVAADHFEQRTRQVVVPVGEGNAPQQLAGPVHEFRSDPGRERLGAGPGGHGQDGDNCEKAMKRHDDPFPAVDRGSALPRRAN